MHPDDLVFGLVEWTRAGIELSPRFLGGVVDARPRDCWDFAPPAPVDHPGEAARCTG